MENVKIIVLRLEEGAVTLRLVRSSLDRAPRGPLSRRSRKGFAPGKLCSWARHLTVTVSIYTQLYKWVPAKQLSVS